MELSIPTSEHKQYDGVLPLDINYIPEFVLAKSNKELNVSSEERNNRLLELIKLLEGNKASKGIAFKQDFLQRYLINSGYDIKQAYSRVQNYLDLYRNHSSFFQSISFDFTVNPSCKFITILPHRSSDGSITFLYEMGNWNPAEVSFDVVQQLPFIISMQELRNPVTQLAGVNAIFDFKNTTFQHLKCCTPYNMHLSNHVSFEVVPVIYRRYHIVNGNSVLNKLLTLLKPFLPALFKKILHIHSSPEELLDYFPKSMLPIKYGGTLKDYYMADRLKKLNEQQDNYPVEGQRNTF